VRGVWSVIAALVISIWYHRPTWQRLPQAHRHPGQRCQCLAAADLQYRQPGRLRFGDRLAGGIRCDQPWVTTAGGDNPLISLAIAVNLLAGMTGSASGGMSIALATLGDTYLAMGQAAGISPELMHRVTAVATGGLDALPHNGAVITLLSICGLTHRQSYAWISR
jgi:hypothetical protein